MSDDEDRVPRAARERQHERAEHVESILDEVEEDLYAHDFPTTSDELAGIYSRDPIDLPNETESLADVLDRIDDRFESPEEVRETVRQELLNPTGEEADVRPSYEEPDESGGV